MSTSYSANDCKLLKFCKNNWLLDKRKNNMHVLCSTSMFNRYIDCIVFTLIMLSILILGNRDMLSGFCACFIFSSNLIICFISIWISISMHIYLSNSRVWVSSIHRISTSL